MSTLSAYDRVAAQAVSLLENIPGDGGSVFVIAIEEGIVCNIPVFAAEREALACGVEYLGLSLKQQREELDLSRV